MVGMYLRAHFQDSLQRLARFCCDCNGSEAVFIMFKYCFEEVEARIRTLLAFHCHVPVDVSVFSVNNGIQSRQENVDRIHLGVCWIGSFRLNGFGRSGSLDLRYRIYVLSNG